MHYKDNPSKNYTDWIGIHNEGGEYCNYFAPHDAHRVEFDSSWEKREQSSGNSPACFMNGASEEVRRRKNLIDRTFLD